MIIEDEKLLAEDVLLPFEPLFYKKGLTLDSSTLPVIQIRGSQSHVQQVLEILLDNAMKYSTPVSTAFSQLGKKANHTRLSVSNPGGIISVADLKNSFKRFCRLDKSRSRDSGYGLGLSISESIVRLHKGRIWA